MPTGLKRYYGSRHLHFITFSCYRRLPLLGSARTRDRFLRTLEEVRAKYRFVLVGYVVMPEHVHLLISEPPVGAPSKVMQVLKQRSSRALKTRRGKAPTLFTDDDPPRQFWQTRFYDFNVFSQKKRIEKLQYMHNNPVKRGLAPSPELWRWSSYRWYAFQELGPVTLNDWPEAKLAMKAAASG